MKHKYQVLKLKNFKYYKQGIYYEFKDILSKRSRKRFVRVATITPLQPIEIKFLTNQKREDLETQVDRIRDSYSKSIISEKIYFKRIKPLRQEIFANYPFTNSKNIENWKQNWDGKRKGKAIIQELKTLVDAGIEVIFIWTELKSYTSEYQKLIVILIDYGPVYSITTNKQKVINRKSPLDLYKNLKKFKSLIYIKHNCIIDTFHHLIKNHDQTIQLPYPYLLEFVNHVTQNNTMRSISKLWYKFVYLNRFKNPICYFTTQNFTHNVSINENLYYKKIASLKPGNGLIVKSSVQDFYDFILSYSFWDYVRNNHENLYSEKQNQLPVFRDKVIVFSKTKPLGFIPITPQNLRLDLIKMHNPKNLERFFKVFKIIDIVYGSKFLTTQTNLRKLAHEIKEFDTQKLLQITNHGMLKDLISKQLTNQSFVSDTKGMWNILELINQFQSVDILNSDSNYQSNSKNPQDKTNIGEIPYFTFIDISIITPKETLLMMILILFKITIINQEPGEDSVLSENNEYTIILDDPRLIRVFSNENVIKLIEGIFENTASLKIIIHKSDESISLPLSRFLKFSMNTKDDQVETLTKSTLSVGEGDTIDVTPITLVNSDLEKILFWEKLNLEKYSTGLNPFVLLETLKQTEVIQ